ncbi:hypothetical protein ACFQRB_06905 [Halobaculum litoreum]|uniref:Uncharacterized protein n=1 Tax=Halobaculum litoreum TaxID=3031998 RepID=A0ABD5XTE8_9EURY
MTRNESLKSLPPRACPVQPPASPVERCAAVDRGTPTAPATAVVAVETAASAG